jgi:hypothetical protein
MSHCTSTAHNTASTALGNSARHAVTSIFDDPTLVLTDLRTDEFAAVGLQTLVRPLLIRSHQTPIADDIGGEDRGMVAVGGGHTLASLGSGDRRRNGKGESARSGSPGDPIAPARLSLQAHRS